MVFTVCVENVIHIDDKHFVSCQTALSGMLFQMTVDEQILVCVLMLFLVSDILVVF